MILVGCSDANVLSENLKNKISQFDNIVVLKETTSNLRHDSFIGKIDQIIAPIELSTHRDKIFEKLKPELLITIGGMIISKRLKQCSEIIGPYHTFIWENMAQKTPFILG